MYGNYKIILYKCYIRKLEIILIFFWHFQANATKIFANRVLYSTCDIEINESVSININLSRVDRRETDHRANRIKARIEILL